MKKAMLRKLRALEEKALSDEKTTKIVDEVGKKVLEESQTKNKKKKSEK